jgi:hypothetical protein
MAKTDFNANKAKNEEKAPVAIDQTATAVQTENVQEAPENPEEEATPSETVVSGADFKNIIIDLIKNKGCKKISGLRVKNVTLKQQENYLRASLTLMNKIPCFVPVNDDNGDVVEYKQGLVNVIYTSSFAIAAILKNDEENAWLGGHIIKHPQGILPLLVGSTISVIQQFVPEGTEYVNPFTTREDADPIPFDHDTIIYHIVDITLGKSGVKFADKMMDKVVDSMFEEEE